MATAAVAIGVGVLAVGSIMEGNAQASALRSQAAISAQNAVLSKEDAAAAERASRIETARLISAQRAAAGASGSALSGSALLLMSDAAIEGELEAQGIRRRGGLAANRFALEASALKKGANAAVIGGVFGAGATLFSGASSLGTTGLGTAG